MVEIGSGQLQKATLRAVDASVSPSSLRFAYNPSELTTAKSATWTRPTTNSAPSATRPQFGGTNPQSVSMEIFFDAWDDPNGDVSTMVKTLFEWLKPTQASRGRNLPNPPVLVFEWGSSQALAGFRGFLKSVNAKYTLFRPDGKPVRATCSIALEEVPNEPAGQNPTSGSRSSRRSVLLGEGDSLPSVAWREYGDPALWRGLAAFNGIDDPLRVATGTRLLVPSLVEAHQLARGEG